MMPRNVEAEQVLLGGIFADPSMLDEVAPLLSAEDFWDSRHQAIWKAIEGLRATDRVADEIQVHDWLKTKNLLTRAGEVEYLVQLAEAAPGPGYIPSAAAAVKAKARLRELATAAGDIYESAKGDGIDDERRFISESAHSISEIYERSLIEGGDKGVAAQRLMGDALRAINRRQEDPKADRGISSGFLDVDRVFTGMRPGHLLVLAARPSMGKTALAMQIAMNAALEDNERQVLFFSLEQPANELGERAIAAKSRVSYEKLQTGVPLNSGEADRMIDAAKTIGRSGLTIQDTPGISPAEIQAVCRRHRRLHGRLDLVMVDHLDLLTPDHRYQNSRYREVTETSATFKRLARDLGIPVLMLHQLNREVERRKDKRPILSDLRDSGAIEQDADVVWLLYRPAYYTSLPEDEGKAELRMAKQRNGRTGAFTLQWDAPTVSFGDLSRQSPF